MSTAYVPLSRFSRYEGLRVMGIAVMFAAAIVAQFTLGAEDPFGVLAAGVNIGGGIVFLSEIVRNRLAFGETTTLNAIVSVLEGEES